MTPPIAGQTLGDPSGRLEVPPMKRTTTLFMIGSASEGTRLDAVTTSTFGTIGSLSARSGRIGL
jgi:hypothetical protein